MEPTVFLQPRPQGVFPSKAREKRPGDEVGFSPLFQKTWMSNHWQMQNKGYASLLVPLGHFKLLIMLIRPGCEHGPTTPNCDTQTIELNIYSQRFWMASVHHGLTVPLQGWCNMRISSDSVLPCCVPTGNRAWKVSGTQGTCCDTF